MAQEVTVDIRRDLPWLPSGSTARLVLGRVERLKPFVDTEEVSDRTLLEPSDARHVRWVQEYLPLYEHALARARARRQRAPG